MAKVSSLRKQLGDKPIWLNWRLGKAPGGNLTKIPIGTSTDPSTWTTYDKLRKPSAALKMGRGIVFPPDRLLLGVDIDHCLEGDTITHEEKENIAQFIIEADTYTEISPSGTGLHLFFLLDKPFIPSSNKRAPYEIYSSGRFFTVTEKPYKEDKAIRTVTEQELEALLAIIGYPWSKKNAQKEAKSDAPSAAAPSLDDAEVLERAFNSKNGATIRSLYDTDGNASGADTSSLDMALCNHLAFWTGGNHAQIERLWTASPLGQRAKTQTRQDYRTRTINEAIDNCSDFYTPPSTTVVVENEDGEDVKLDLLFTIKNKYPVFTKCVENYCRILRKHPHFADRIRYDEFKVRMEYRPFGEGVYRPFRDSDVIEVQAEIAKHFDFFQTTAKEMIYDALVSVGLEKKYDSARDYIAAIEWDGTPRLSTWLTEVYGAPDDKYHRAVGSNWLKGLVKRIAEPGCKFDYVLVLEGEQGAKKSTSLAILGGDWHVETTMGTDSKDFFMQFQGKAIIEFSEGETLSRTEVKRMKAIISTQVDTYRPPYERIMRDFPRRCVFAMTTNQEEYLKDETGNRRWLPVRLELPEANTDWLIENRDQLFAEAYHRVVNLKETIWEFPHAETLEAQRARRISDPNTDAVVDWYLQLSKTDRLNGVTVDEAAKQALHMGFTGPINRVEQMSIANIFREVLQLQKRQSMTEGVRRIRWYPGTVLDVMKLKVSEDVKTI